MKIKQYIADVKGKVLMEHTGDYPDGILAPLSFEEILENLYYQCMPKNRPRLDKKYFIKQLEFFIKEMTD